MKQWRDRSLVSVLGIVSLLIANEWLRNLDLHSTILNELRESLLGFLLLKKDQWIVLSALVFWYAILFLLNHHNRARTLFSSVWLTMTVADICQLLLVALALVGYGVAWRNLSDFGDRILLSLGVD